MRAAIQQTNDAQGMPNLIAPRSSGRGTAINTRRTNVRNYPTNYCARRAESNRATVKRTRYSHQCAANQREQLSNELLRKARRISARQHPSHMPPAQRAPDRTARMSAHIKPNAHLLAPYSRGCYLNRYDSAHLLARAQYFAKRVCLLWI